jgi:hypothetical protein
MDPEEDKPLKDPFEHETQGREAQSNGDNEVLQQVLSRMNQLESIVLMRRVSPATSSAQINTLENYTSRPQNDSSPR